MLMLNSNNHFPILCNQEHFLLQGNRLKIKQCLPNARIFCKKAVEDFLEIFWRDNLRMGNIVGPFLCKRLSFHFLRLSQETASLVLKTDSVFTFYYARKMQQATLNRTFRAVLHIHLPFYFIYFIYLFFYFLED